MTDAELAQAWEEHLRCLGTTPRTYHLTDFLVQLYCDRMISYEQHSRFFRKEVDKLLEML